MSLRLRIRPVEQEDIGGLIAALAPGVGEAQMRMRFEESLDGYREILVAELDGYPVGTVSTGGHGFQRPGSLRLFALDVGEAFRGQGVGTALVNAVEAAAARPGSSRGQPRAVTAFRDRARYGCSHSMLERPSGRSRSGTRTRSGCTSALSTLSDYVRLSVKGKCPLSRLPC